MKKRKDYLFVLLLLALSVQWTAVAQSYTPVPYTQTFESVSGTLPTGWVNYATETIYSTSYPCVYYSSYASHQGYQHLRMYSNTGAAEVTATCEFANVADLMVNMYISAYADTAVLFEVGVMEDTLFVPVDTVPLNVSASSYTYDYRNYRAYLTAYTGTGSRIAFRVSSTDRYRIHIDDLLVYTAPLCTAMPGSISSVATSTSDTLTWGATTNSSEYVLYLNNDSTYYSTSDTTYIFDNLTPNTAYTGLLYNICTSGDTSEAVSFSFRTQCGEVVLPLVEGFENYTDDIPSCWFLTLAYSSYYSDYPAIDTYADDAHSGSQCMEFSEGPEILSSPRIPLAANEIEVKFWIDLYSYYNDSAAFYVGYVTNPDSASSFVVVDTVYAMEGYTEHTVSFAGITITDTVHVAFAFDDYDGDYIYLDDVTIRQRSDCAIPTELHIVSSSSGAVAIAWTDTVGSTWEVVYGPTGFDPDTVTDNMESGITTDSVTIYNLADSITYDFYVRSDCGGSYSYWVGPAVATPGSYTMAATGIDTLIACNVTIFDDGGAAGDYSNNCNSTLYLIADDTTQTFILSGWSATEYNYDFLTIYDGLGTTGTVLYNSHNNTTSAQTTFGPLVSSQGAVTITFSSDNEYSYDGFAIHANCVDRYGCFDPESVSVTNIAGASATVNWSVTDLATPDYWTIEVIDTIAGQVLSFTAADTLRSYVVTGLSQSTTYQVRLQQTCLSGDTSASLYTWFTTGCLAGGDLLVGNESTTTTSSMLPGNTNYNYALSQQIFDAMEINSLDTIYGIKINKVSGADLTRSYMVYIDTTSASTFASATLIEQDSTALHYNGSVTLTDGWIEILFSQPYVYPGAGNIVITIEDNTGAYVYGPQFATTATTAAKAFYAQSDSYNPDATDSASVAHISNAYTANYRNNIIFMAPCADASCVAPNVTASATTNSITLNWVDGNGETAWRVEYKDADDTTWTTQTASTANTSETISGLSASTTYHIRVTSLCSDTTASALLSVTTACGITALPYNENFDSYTDRETPLCWLVIQPATAGTTTYPTVRSDASYAHSPANVLSFYSNSGQTEVIASPVFDSINTLEIAFSLSKGYSSPDYVEIGVMDSTTFVVYDTLTLPTTTSLSTYTQYLVRFDNYTGNGNRIAFRTTCSSSYYTLYIDDVTVRAIPSCIPPTDLVSTANTSTSVTLSWNANGATAWNIVYDTMPITDFSGYTATAATTNPYTLTGLLPGYTYYIYVQNDCGDGDASAFVGPATVMTGSWIMRVNQTDTVTMCGGAIFDDGGPSGNYSASQTSTIVLRPSTPQSTLSLSGTTATEGSWDYLTIYDGIGTTGTTLWTSLGTYSDSFSNIVSEDGVVTIVFHADYSTQYSGFRIDVTCLSNTCPKVSDIHATATTAASLSIDWTPGGSESQWQIEYDTMGFTPGTGTLQTFVTHPVTLTGLSALTAYDVYVRPICSATDTGRWSSATLVTALCDNPVYIMPDSTADSTARVPVNNYYRNTLTEIILDQSELGNNAAEFNAIMFHYASSTPMDKKDDVDIYIQPTTLTAFGSEDDFVPADSASAVLVYSGNLNCMTGWNTFAFDTTYTYSGSGNLLIIIDDNSNDYDGSGYLFSVAYTDSVRTYSCFGDSYNPSAFSAPTGGYEYVYNYRPLMQLVSCGTGCAAPVVTVSSLGYNQATIAWNGSAERYDVAIKAQSDAVWPAETAVSANTYTFTNLLPATTYQYRVRQQCDTTTLSDWTLGTFVTDSLPCFAPTNLTAQPQGQNATLSWAAGGNETAWTIHVFNTTFDQTYDATANPYTVTGLTAGVTYQAAISANCGNGLVQSAYSDTISFVTEPCDVVSNLTVSGISGNSATISWVPGDNNTGAWEVEYGYHGYGQGEALGTYQTSEPTYTLTALTGNTHYDVTVRAVCATGYYSNNVQTDFTTQTSGIDNVNSSATIALMPNPATSSTTVTLSGVRGNVSLTVIDMSGRTVRSFTMECDGECSHQLLVDDLAAGAYFIRLSGNGVNTVKKLIVK